MTHAPKPIHDMDTKAWTSLGQAVGESLGLASTCWIGGTGDLEFDSEVAETAGKQLLEFIRRGSLDPTRSKGEAIVEDCLIRGEPFFVFRARDIFSTMVLKHYLKILEDYGPDDPDFQADIVHFINQLKNWQTENVADVRYPD